jgi:hypothetical protein
MRPRERDVSIVRAAFAGYDTNMIQIRFPDLDAKRRALAYLAGRFPFTSYRSGEMLVPSEALAELAVAAIPFSVEGPPTYGQAVPALRDPAPAAVQ